MRKFIIITTIISFSISLSFAQKAKIDPQMIELGWNFIAPYIVQKISDPLTKEIITKAIPKIIKEDVKGAAYEIGDATFRVKGVKVLNKEYLGQQEARINVAIKAIKTRDYATAVNELATLVSITDRYIKSGILDKPEQKPEIVVKEPQSEIVKSEEVNGKVYIEKNNSYYFFVPNGSVSEIPNRDSSGVKFKLNLANGKSFEMGIYREPIDDENLSIDYIEKNPSFKDEWTSFISKELLKKFYGDGIASASTLYTANNFKAYKFPYLASKEALMTTTLITFHNAQEYAIYFKTSQSDYPENSKIFYELMNMFYFGERLQFCSIKRMGIVNVTNKSLNPYDLYCNGNLITTMKPKSEFKFNVPLGTNEIKAIQKSGFMLYATENLRTVIINGTCESKSIEVGFVDLK